MKAFVRSAFVVALCTSLVSASELRLRKVSLEPLAPSELAARHDGRHLFVQGTAFDPTLERPDFGALGLPRIVNNEYAIVQFRAGQLAAKQELEKLGVEFLSYLPDNAYQVKMSPAGRRQVSASSAVRWVGEYEAGYKVSPRLLDAKDRSDQITVQLFRGGSYPKLHAMLSAEFGDVERIALYDSTDRTAVRYRVPLARRSDFVRKLAGIPFVSWIEPFNERRLHNAESLSVIQSNTTGDAGRTIFNRNITGTGQIVAVSDSGLDSDMCFFRNYDGKNAPTVFSNPEGSELGPLFMDQKVIGYFVQEGADPYDAGQYAFHGTHTSGTVLGDNFATPAGPTTAGIDRADGMAPHAQLLFQDIGPALGTGLTANDTRLMFLQALNAGARVHSNSWGGDSFGDYTFDDMLADEFLFDHDEMAIVFSAGNSGTRGASSTGSPGNAKNVITVGALRHGSSTSAALFSSKGPTADGRIKPDIMAPGEFIVSAAGDDIDGNGNCGVGELSGTSMSAPTVAGGAALLRQYFADGYYPTGVANAADKAEARAPLVKAVLLNGTLALPAGSTFGHMTYGWGRIFLDNNLYFAGDARKLRTWYLPTSHGVRTGDAHTYTVNVAAGQELRSTLVWSDPEATLGASSNLVNNLDLIVTGPNGTVLGNVFTTTGESTTGGLADVKNNVEQVRFTAPMGGTYTLRVKATAVPGNGRYGTDRQGYALVASHATCGTGVGAAPSGLAAQTNATIGVDLSWSPAAGSAVTQVYRAAAGTNDYQYIGSTTGNTFTDTRAQGGITYSYRVRGADGCGEGPASSAVTFMSTGACDLLPTFRGVTTAEAAGTSCRINLSWSAGTSACPLGPSLRYNIYRSTTPDVPATGAPYATVTTTTFSDLTVTSGQTYYYVVRAEDTTVGSAGPHGGNQDFNVVRTFATASGAPGATGTWRDSGGDPNALMIPEGAWNISSEESQSGGYAYRSAVPGDMYPAMACASIKTPPITLDANAQLSYYARFNLEWEWDGVIVEISNDAGASWAALPPDQGYPGTLAETMNPPINACGDASTAQAFTGPILNHALTEWTQYTSSLAAYGGQTVQIRWRLTTDPGLEYEGFHLDTVEITNAKLPSSCTPIDAKPEARFIAPDSAKVGTAVSFRDDSLNAPTSWLWSFGDGSSSTEQHPVKTYSATGTYNVTLTATNAHGSTTSTKSIVIHNNSSARTRAARRQ